MARLVAPDAAGIAAAVEALAAGRLILHPTETVVSLSGDPRRAEAVERARRLKGYVEPRPFLCLVPDIDAARGLAAHWPRAAADLAAAFWPGPLTLVVAAADSAPPAVVEEGRIGVRPASEAVSAALLAAWKAPLFSTSANPRGEPPALGVAEAARAFDADDEPAVGLLEWGDTPGDGVPSSVVDVTGRRPRLVRGGAVPREALVRVCATLE